jgi:hypothetical protein
VPPDEVQSDRLPQVGFEFRDGIGNQFPSTVHHGREIHSDFRDMDAERCGMAGIRGKPGGGDHRLAGRAAEIDAGAAEMFALEKHDGPISSREGPRERHSGLARADNGRLCRDLVHIRRTTAKTRCMIPAFSMERERRGGHLGPPIGPPSWWRTRC